MVLYVLSNQKKIGGVFQWEQFIENSIVIYEIINFEINDVIYLNNYTKADFFNQKKLQSLVDLKINIYFVFHSDLCPINKLFVTFKKYFYGVISTNLHVYQKLKLIYPSIPNIFIPNISKINAENISGPKENKRLHYVGRLSPEKNLPMLLSAMRMLDGYTLHIFGEINVKYFVYLNKLCELLQITNKVFFMGHRDSKFDLYNQASALILPSVHEGLPYCLLEGNAYGIPLIYNDISKISLHISGEVAYCYDGYDNNLNTKLYIDSYLELLKMIGYAEFTIDVQSMIALNKITNKSHLKLQCLHALIMHYGEKITVGEKFTVPPFLLQKSCANNKFESNVLMLVKTIKNFCEKID